MHFTYMWCGACGQQKGKRVAKVPSHFLGLLGLTGKYVVHTIGPLEGFERSAFLLDPGISGTQINVYIFHLFYVWVAT